VCVGSFDTLDEVTCALDALEQAPCGKETLPRSLERLIRKRMKRGRKLLGKMAEHAAAGRDDKVARLRAKTIKQIDAIGRKASRVAAAGSESRNISEECHATIDGLLTARRQYVQDLTF
jgi:hypothetical protein